LKLTYARNPDIIVRSLDDEVLLVDNETDAIFNLNPIGTAIWQFLQIPKKDEEIIETLKLAFPDSSPQQIVTDTKNLLRQLVERDLVIMTCE